MTEVELNSVAGRVDVWVEDCFSFKWKCQECQEKASVYDQSKERVWRHLNTRRFGTCFHRRLPRVKCPRHGVRQVLAPWAEPGGRFTLLFENRTIYTLKKRDITGTNHLTGTGWYEAWNIMDRTVERGLSRKKRRIPEYPGIDEKSFAGGHRYETVICDLSKGTVECVIEDRKQESLEAYLGRFSKEDSKGIKAIVMDR